MQKTKRIIFEYMMIVLGTFLISYAVNVFLIPLKLSSGGIGSIGTVLLYVFNVPLSVTNIVLNAILFIAGYRFLSKTTLIKTVFGIIFFTIFLQLTTYMHIYKEDILISSLAGGILIGIGVGVVIRTEASTGGSDFAGLMLSKLFPHFSVPVIILFIDCFIIILSGIVFGSITITFYSAIVLVTAAKVSDFVLFVGDRAKMVFVISKSINEVSLCITQKFNRGATGIYCRGMYSSEDKLMLFCALSPRELPKIVKEIKSIDPDAFVVITDAREVIGEGFKKISS